MNIIEDTVLCTLIDEMEVPEERRRDVGWLRRNLPFRNIDHPCFQEAWRRLGMSTFREGGVNSMDEQNADTERRRCITCDNVSMGSVPEGWRCPVCRGVMKRWPKRVIVMSDDGVDVIDPELTTD